MSETKKPKLDAWKDHPVISRTDIDDTCKKRWIWSRVFSYMCESNIHAIPYAYSKRDQVDATHKFDRLKIIHNGNFYLVAVQRCWVNNYNTCYLNKSNIKKEFYNDPDIVCIVMPDDKVYFVNYKELENKRDAKDLPAELKPFELQIDQYFVFDADGNYTIKTKRQYTKKAKVQVSKEESDWLDDGPDFDNTTEKDNTDIDFPQVTEFNFGHDLN